MSKAKFCHTCIFWEKDIFTRAGEKFGICHEVIASSKMLQDTETKVVESQTVYTEECFGCIYWRDNDGVLIDTSAIVKDQLKEDGYDT